MQHSLKSSFANFDATTVFISHIPYSPLLFKLHGIIYVQCNVNVCKFRKIMIESLKIQNANPEQYVTFTLNL